MTKMTDEDAARLDEKWTKNPPRPGPNGTGYFTRCTKAAADHGIAYTITIDRFTADYLSIKAAACRRQAFSAVKKTVAR
ncbi:MAG: hypothetical protein LBD08_04850 [Treponema sp.]|jgi:hypothetical protein|nr:hypothetical protein [Treponema sp.]